MSTLQTFQEDETQTNELTSSTTSHDPDRGDLYSNFESEDTGLSDDSSQDSSSSDGNIRTSELDEMLGRNSDLDEPLYAGSKLSRSQSLVMVMAHSPRHHASKEATESLLKVLDAHLPQGTSFPNTKFLFFKNSSSLSECRRTAHTYCPECLEYLTAEPSTTSSVQCPQCNSTHSVTSLLQSGSFFFTLDIDTQIKQLLTSGKLLQSRLCRSYDVGDISQSAAYSRLPITSDDISVTWNTDGVPLFESSGHSVWPLLLQVNELPYKDRVQQLLLFGLWFGAKKPKMNSFLKPFAQTMNRLSSEGIAWTTQTGENKTCRVYPGPCTVDTVARCMVMNMNQFNGAHSCAWCEHSGEVVDKGRGHTRVYVMQRPAARLRTHERFVKHAKQAQERGVHRLGVKGPSVLFFMTFFNFCSSFVVDYMHAVCNGFARATTFLWFSHKKRSAYNIGSYMSQVDEQLRKMTPVWEMSRLPRPLSEMKFWKASEWRDWVLYFSPVVLKEYLPKTYYKNWTKFVQIMHFCLQSHVPVDKIGYVKKAMEEFLEEYEQLYGIHNMTYNAHILLHMVDHVKEWGPLWGFSAYPFESINGKLVRFVNGTRYAHSQIVEKFCILQNIPQILSTTSPWQHDDLKLFVRSLLKGYNMRKASSKCGSIYLFGKGRKEDGIMKYKKATVGSFTYCVDLMDKSRRKNSFVSTGADSFGQITDIFTTCTDHPCTVNAHVCFRLRKLYVLNSMLSCIAGSNSVHFASVQEANAYVTVSALDVRKCIVLSCSGQMVLSMIPEEYVLESV
ncbi:uncharacterized protein LOC135370047 [Ornithodoros turicata]|uniref:uncharacterized protein LOC135370047 n=1 Tax=Ornithodoros turicata TaxID=34597 RepID=UPI003139E1BE